MADELSPSDGRSADNSFQIVGQLVTLKKIEHFCIT